ncbi:MAG: D-glycerate dehydrogenase [Acidobacteria bacterium]|jgi:glyoxylate reductase|nr:D-glycerate dehydrogenase [Acidobacteriota bacterium]
MHKVILAHRYHDDAVERLRREFRLVIADEEEGGLPECMRRHPDAEGLISFLSDPVDAAAIGAMKNLKIIANFAVGYNNIDVGRALERNVLVTHTPDVLTHATADLAMALVLAVARRLLEGDAFMRSGGFHGWQADLLLGKELSGAILGIVGMGRIGLATALRARAFGMKIVFYSRSPKPLIEKKHGFARVTFLELIRSADVVSLHLPYSPGVHHLFSHDVFALMKKDAIFINTARGPLMDEQALAAALEKNELFGAGLDVYEHEPAVNDTLRRLPNATLLPHLGSATGETRRQMALMTVQSVRQALAGKRPRHLIPEWKEKLKK